MPINLNYDRLPKKQNLSNSARLQEKNPIFHSHWLVPTPNWARRAPQIQKRVFLSRSYSKKKKSAT